MIDANKFLGWCEARYSRLSQIAEIVMRAPDSTARSELFQAILAALANCVDMVVEMNALANEHHVAGRSARDFTLPIDVEAIDAADADIHLRALVLSPAAGAA